MSTTPALAVNGDGLGGTTASAAGGTVTVRAKHPGHPARQPPDHAGGGASSGPAPVCTYTPLGSQASALLGTGGPAPGEWVIPSCSFPNGYVGNPMPPVWVAQAPSASPRPAVLAQQAVSQLPLPAPSIEMAPPADHDQLVNVSTWLWVNPASWRALSATATAGPVSATASATPAEVVWNMGDGDTVTCAGPGIPYDSADPNATTDCSYTWTQSSASQPGGAYQITATIYWQVTWSAVGAPGGGSLGLVPGPASHLAVRVAESEALNTTSGG